jgi:nitric oxide reductase activation protein
MYYIHYEDPSFNEAPWPGQRRSGGYLTLDEAKAQAINDIAVGAGIPVGIYDEDGSEALRNDLAAEVEDQGTVPELVAAADELIVAKVQTEAQTINENRDALQSQLPEGVDLQDVLDLIEGGG